MTYVICLINLIMLLWLDHHTLLYSTTIAIVCPLTSLFSDDIRYWHDVEQQSMFSLWLVYLGETRWPDTTRPHCVLSMSETTWHYCAVFSVCHGEITWHYCAVFSVYHSETTWHYCAVFSVCHGETTWHHCAVFWVCHSEITWHHCAVFSVCHGETTWHHCAVFSVWQWDYMTSPCSQNLRLHGLQGSASLGYEHDPVTGAAPPVYGQADSPATYLLILVLR